MTLRDKLLSTAVAVVGAIAFGISRCRAANR